MASRETFLPERNGLDFLRLVLAASVLFWHSFQLTGWGELWAPARQLFECIGVDGFFAISGFLILQSRERKNAWPFAKARLLRIYPALIVCLALTAFVIAPFFDGYSAAAALSYFGLNLGMLSRFDGALRIGDTLADNVKALAWNSSLWTLRFELLFYCMVLALGRRGRSTSLPLIWGLWSFAWLALASGAWFGHEGPLGLQASTLGRTLLMFCSGMLIYKYRARLVVNNSWMMASALVVLVAASLSGVGWGWAFAQSYQLLASLPLAYLVLMFGAKLGARERFVLRNDYSYGVYIYGFMVQQVLVAVAIDLWGTTWLHNQGLAVFGLLVASGLVTFGLAALSWRFIERPALRLK